MEEIKKFKTKEIIMSILLVFLILLVVFISLLVISNKGSSNVQEVPNNNLLIANYLDVSSIDTTNYDSVFSEINLKKITFKNLNNNITNDFETKQQEDLDRLNTNKDYILKYNTDNNITNYKKISTVNQTLLTEINNNILSILYIIEENIDYLGKNSYINSILINIDNNTIIKNTEFLSTYNINKNDICSRIFDIFINEYDLSTVNLTIDEAKQHKEEYVSKLITNFDDLIYPYINDENIYVKYSKNYIAKTLFDVEAKEIRYSTLKV